MAIKDATVSRKHRLWKLCEKFILDQDISCPESIYQCDWVHENAYELIDEICKIVGFSPRPREDEDDD